MPTSRICAESESSTFRNSNLHVVSYSQPVKQRMALAELKEHMFTAPGSPGLDSLSHLLL